MATETLFRDLELDGASVALSRPPTIEQIVALWNAWCPSTTITKINLTPKRRIGLRQRLKEHRDPAVWERGIRQILLSPFCRETLGLRQAFDKVCIRRDFIVKAAEGLYAERRVTATPEERRALREWRMQLRSTMGDQRCCPHPDPICESLEDCNQRQVRTWRARG